MNKLDADLPADFPHKNTLASHGLRSVHKIVAFLDLDHDLTIIDGIDRAASDGIIRVVQDAVAESNNVQN